MHSKNSKKSKNTDKKSISNYDQPPMKKSQPFDNINFKKEEDPSTPIQKSNDNRTSRSSNRDLLKEKEEPHEDLAPIEKISRKRMERKTKKRKWRRKLKKR